MKTQIKTIAIIPARKNSKRIKGKNIFCAKTKVVLLNPKKHVDIDNHSDLKKAKKIFKNENI